MNENIQNAVYPYFNVLNELNKELLIMCGLNAYDSPLRIDQLFYSVMSMIYRLVPFKKNEKLVINPNDGLLDFKTDFVWLEAEFISLLDSHYCVIDSIRMIRNKFEHKMHDGRSTSYLSGTDLLFSVDFEVEDNKTKINLHDLIDITKKLNIIYGRIMLELKSSIDAKVLTGPYFERLFKRNFNHYTEIFNLNYKTLQIIGRIFVD